MSKPEEYIELPLSQFGSVGAMIAERRIEQMAARIAELEEFVREVSLLLETDSDLESLLETLRERAVLNPPNNAVCTD